MYGCQWRYNSTPEQFEMFVEHCHLPNQLWDLSLIDRTATCWNNIVHLWQLTIVLSCSNAIVKLQFADGCLLKAIKTCRDIVTWLNLTVLVFGRSYYLRLDITGSAAYGVGIVKKHTDFRWAAQISDSKPRNIDSFVRPHSCLQQIRCNICTTLFPKCFWGWCNQLIYLAYDLPV